MIRRKRLRRHRQSLRTSQSPDGDFFDPEVRPEPPRCGITSSHSPLTGIFLIRSYARLVHCGSCDRSQSPDGDFFDPEEGAFLCHSTGVKSQSPDGDFFDPETGGATTLYEAVSRSHSPLTGIFLIRRRRRRPRRSFANESQSPDGDFFDPESYYYWYWYLVSSESQSPDGDFFDPEVAQVYNIDHAGDVSQSPDGDFFDPEFSVRQ